MNPLVLDSNPVLEQYEALRRDVLAAGSSFDRGLGLSLFLTRGMSAWLSAVTALMPRSPRPAMISGPAQFERMPVLAPSVRSDLTVMLADMVLACSVEVAR
jgi:hypothetical protein